MIKLSRKVKFLIWPWSWQIISSQFDIFSMRFYMFVKIYIFILAVRWFTRLSRYSKKAIIHNWPIKSIKSLINILVQYKKDQKKSLEWKYQFINSISTIVSYCKRENTTPVKFYQIFGAKSQKKGKEKSRTFHSYPRNYDRTHVETNKRNLP